MTTQIMIHAAIGKREHSPFWEKGELSGVQLQVATETHSTSNKEESPQELPAYSIESSEHIIVGQAEIPVGTLLTFYWSSGEWAGTVLEDFWILQTSAQAQNHKLGGSTCYIQGKFDILAHGGSNRALRLIDWWQNWTAKNGGQTPEIARWLGVEIKRGVKSPALKEKTNPRNS